MKVCTNARKGSVEALPERTKQEFALLNGGHWMGEADRMALAVSCHGAKNHRVVKQVKG